MTTVQQTQTPFFHILGRRLDCSGCGPTLTRQLQSDWLFPHHQGQDTAFTIIIREVEELKHMMTGVPVTVHAMQQDVLFLVADQEVAFNSGGHLLIRASFGERVSQIEVWHKMLRTRLNLAALKVTVAEALRVSGLLPLHAAAAGRNAQACAFIGPSGTGKSTTLLRAVAAGWTALAEDFVWIDPASSQVYGWDRGLRLLPDSLKALPAALAQHHWKTHPDGKHWVPFEALEAFQGFESKAVPLSRVAVLVRDSDRMSTWSACPRHLGVQSLWSAAGLALTRAGTQATGYQLSRLLAQVDIQRLVLGTGPLPL